VIIDAAVRRRLVAHLARALGLPHLGLVEDTVQVACLRALETWPRDGEPDNRAGWLYRVAWRHAVDQLRGEKPADALPDGDDAALPDTLTAPAAEGRFAGELDDDELALLFAACHPAVPEASQVALALRAACALELRTIADALLTSEAALQQRLARARVALQGVPLEAPAGAELAPRREAVLATLMLMFQAGWRAGGRAGDGTSARPESLALAWEAIRLARALAAHPAVAHADADALAALLLLHGARLSGRFDAAGDIVPLAGQDRDRWDASMVRMGMVHLQAAMRAPRLSRWHLLAGIAAEHAMAPDWAQTRWSAIVGYYEQLVAIDPSAAPRLGHAIALAEGGAPQAAREALTALLPQMPEALRPHTLAALARAHERLGERSDARARLHEAILLARTDADARLLARRAQALDAGE
jgi:RNA polymerase sigma-70 factor (ECF subfamily)